MSLRFIALSAVLSLAACGGGGGGSSDAGTAGGVGSGGTAAALTFSPSTVTANVASGSSATLTVRATATDPSVFSGTVYAVVLDSQHVISPSVELTATNGTTASATIHTLPTLAAGRYQGSLQVELCLDAACKSQLPGSPVPLPYDFTITNSPLVITPGASTAASLHAGGSASTVAIAVESDANQTWTAATTANWLRVTGGTGKGRGSFSVAYAAQQLTPGSYSATVSVTSADGQTAAVPFSVEVLPTAFVFSGTGALTFSAVNGAPIASQSVNLSLDNGTATSWQATASQSWLLATPLSGTTPAVIAVQPDPRLGSLMSGTYSADLTLSAGLLATKVLTTTLTLTAPTLSSSSSTITLGGPRGRDMTTAQSVSLRLNTGTNSWPVTVSGLPAGVTVSVPGSVNQSGATMLLSPVATTVTPGSTASTVTLTSAVNGDHPTLPLTLNINADQRRLLPSEWGVGFASTPMGSVTTRALSIRDNFGSAISWSAVSDAAWLTVTANGTTGSSSTLSLSANASILPMNVVSFANVTVSTVTAGVAPAVIKVALWRGASGPSAITKLPNDYASLVADTIRPYVYANNGATSIDVYNAYTAQLVTTIAGVGASLDGMTVSLDGRTLYVLDTANKAMVTVDLSTMTKSGSWSLDNAVSPGTTLVATRPNGVEAVFLSDYSAYSAGRSLGFTGVAGQAATSDGQKVMSTGLMWTVDYSAMSGGMLFVSPATLVDSHSGGNALDVAVSKDGSRVYVASGGGTSGGGYRCGVVDGATGAFIGALPGGDAYPNNVEVTNDGRPICGISGWYSTYDIWVHATNGALIQGYKFAGYAKGMKSGQMVVTPDGLIVVALTDDPLIAFVPIGPP